MPVASSATVPFEAANRFKLLDIIEVLLCYASCSIRALSMNEVRCVASRCEGTGAIQCLNFSCTVCNESFRVSGLPDGSGRRELGMPDVLFKFEEFELDSANFQLRRSGSRVHLQKIP